MIFTSIHIDVHSDLVQDKSAPQLHFSEEILAAADDHIAILLAKGAIKVSQHEPWEFISNVFLRPKKDGGYHLILNLKKFNCNVRYNKFEMESLQHILDLAEPFCYMTSMDFDSAYLTYLVAPEHQKF